jgi:hypothetical protein
MDDTRQEYEQRVAHLGTLTPEGMLRELLAVLHGDGGQHVDGNGLARSVASAEVKHHAAVTLHGQLLEVIEVLMTGDPELTTPAGKALDRLGAAVEAYEIATFPFPEMPATGWKTDKLGSSLAWPADTSTDADGVAPSDPQTIAPHTPMPWSESDRGLMVALQDVLDGRDTGEGVCNEPWETLRRRLLAVEWRE